MIHVLHYKRGLLKYMSEWGNLDRGPRLVNQDKGAAWHHPSNMGAHESSDRQL